jgi:transposase InsO family protein
MIDTFTRWPVAVPVKDRSSTVIATAIHERWICEKSVPLKIVSDRGREFVSRGMRQLSNRLGCTLITTSGYNPTGNSSVERFHRYLNSALSIVYAKVRPDWDEHIPSILFAYRASVNETTGHSPFYLEHGRDPQLPMGNLFPFMRKKEPVENFVQDLSDKLERAFERTRELQKAAAARNKARQPAQFKPDFKPGDLLLLHARSAKEGRLEEKTEEGASIAIPNKLRNQLTGPYTMIRWVGERYCAILIDGKEVIHNVNRLVKHHVWDDTHTRTDMPAEKRITHTPEIPPKIGELIVFPTAYNEQHKCLFGIGKILEIQGPNNVVFQWLGNKPLAEASKPFALGWVDPRDNKGYYATMDKSRYSHGASCVSDHCKRDLLTAVDA